MANSFAFVISKNTYPDAFQASLIGVEQGTRIVYSATDTLTSESVLYADSRLTQPIYGDGTSWYGVQLLTNTSVVYPITISESGVIAIGSGTTTTTAGPTTTTTTGSPFFGNGVGYHPAVGSAACGSPAFNNVAGNGTTFCNSTVFTSSDFNTVGGGPSVWIAYGGYYLNVSMTTPNTAIVIGTCQAC